jgi:hypothetical protein
MFFLNYYSFINSINFILILKPDKKLFQKMLLIYKPKDKLFLFYLIITKNNFNNLFLFEFVLKIVSYLNIK